MGERRKIIKSHPDYSISSAGEVRRETYGKGTHPGRVLKPSIYKRGGYLGLRLPPDFQHRMIHRLVLEAFVGPRPKGHEACHRDGNPLNNHLDNLYWGTRSDNVQDMLRHGTYAKTRPTNRGSDHHQAILSEEDVLTIRSEYRKGRSSVGGNAVELATRFGVSYYTIYCIANRKTWRHLP